MTSKESQPTKGLHLISGLAALGLALSLLLEYVHASTYLSPSANSFCSVGTTFDCAAVAASSSSIFLGVPWALWGAIGFIALLSASLQRSPWLVPLSLFSALVSLVLLGVSLLQVGNICYLCEGVHLVSWLLAYLSVKNRKALVGSFSSSIAIATVLSPAAALALACLLFVPHYWASFSYKGEPPFAQGTTAEGYHWLGAETPSKTVHEFVDYTCPHCKVSSSRTLRELSKNSDWRLVRRHQPRMRCQKNIAAPCLSLRMALCSESHGKFWRADRWLFAHAEPRNPFEPTQMARDLNLPEAEFLSCVESDATYERADALAKEARKIVDVPTYLVDGKKLKPTEVAELFD